MKPRFTNYLLMSATALLVVSGVAVAQPVRDDNQGVHVYPGAQPINAPDNAQDSSAAGETQSAEQPQAAQQSPPPNEPETQPAEPRPQAADEQQAQPQADADKDAQAQEQIARQTVAATQHYAVGTHYFSRWDLDLAELEFDEAVSIYPELKIAHRDLCLVSLLKLNLPRSLAEFMMVTGITDPLAYNAKDKADLDAKAMRLHYRKALWWGKQYNWRESITELLWAQMYSPNNASIHHSLAFAYASSGDFERAEQEYKLTFGEDPQNADAHADYATMLMDNGQIARAEAEMRKAVELSPNAAALHVDLGMIAEAHKDYPEAAKEFQTAVQLSPKHAWLWAHLGQLLEHQGQTTEAQNAYLKALALDSECQEAKTSLDRLRQQKPAA